MKQSLKNKKSKNHTIKRRTRFSNSIKTNIIEIFLGMLNAIKIYHWKTYSFSQHKATDELYTKLNEDIDKFVEILLGKDENRFTMIDKHIQLYNFNGKKSFKTRIYGYRDFLIYLTQVLDQKKDTDLLNVRDEILGDINQFLYLMTFNK